MKPLPFMAALVLALPISAWASVAMEAQQATGSEKAIQSTTADASAHRPLFIVRYVLLPAPKEAPQIVMDDRGAQLVPPGSSFPAAPLGRAERDPNVVICYGWSCERKP